MDIKLLRLRIENFKGIKTFEPDFDGNNAVIVGENGVGKTSVFDAFLYLLFGKDSTGRKEFSVRPLDANNNPIKGLVLCVEADLEIDGKKHTLKKEHHEKVVKKQLRGYETLCWIDDVPKKVNEFVKSIGEIIPEETFKMLTDLHYFGEKMHWKERRALLLEIAGEIDTPKGFDSLLELLNDRSVDEYKKVVAEQKKRLTKDRDEINPRIDELQRSLDEYAGENEADLSAKRDIVAGEIDELDKTRQTLIDQEEQRQEKIEALNVQKYKKDQRELELTNGTDGIENLLEDKAKIINGVAGCTQAVTDAKSAISLKETEIKSKQAALESEMRTRDGIGKEYEAVNKPADDAKCSLCGQVLPADQLADIEKARKEKLAEIINRGNAAKAKIDQTTAEIEKLNIELVSLKEELEKAEIKLAEGEEYKAAELPKIEAAINNRESVPFDQDESWNEICERIAVLEKKIGEPVSQQMRLIEDKRKTKSTLLEGFNKVLAQADQAKKTAARIEELEAKEKELAQQIANLEQTQSDIEAYKAAESSLIEKAVNGRFKYVEFKLFNDLLCGTLEDCCEATLNGVPYSDMSCGQKMRVGIDIINVLSDHYNLSVPLFLDNAESFTFPVESSSQTIELYAQKDVEKVTMQAKTEKGAAA